MRNFKYAIVGMLFGILLVKSQAISWFRIQEMFRLQSFHMYGIIGGAVVIGMIAVSLIKKFSIKTFSGEVITIPDKKFHWGNVYGGLIFGLGWAVTGACPGPIFAEVGAGFYSVAITMLSSTAGTWIYGRIRHKLPH